MSGNTAATENGTKARKPTKNEQRRAKKKQQKHEKSTPAEPTAVNGSAHVESVADQPVQPTANGSSEDAPETVLVIREHDEALEALYGGILAKFGEEEEPDAAAVDPGKPGIIFGDDDNIADEEQEAETRKRLSKKARKKADKLSIAQLKALVRKPELVEWTDISAQDPKLLLNIKSTRNVVPVPSHWSLKREYLSSKRGIEKPPYVLPKFIQETGISEMRAAILEKQEQATLKQQQRNRVQGKVGSMSIDYNKLYEAFFRRQTKPELTRFGEVYYEGKEYETNLHHLKPGQPSDELREALNMAISAPPPWLINMQHWGPPPSYPALKIPGVNTPIPTGASWGFHPGGFGKMPVDDQNRPLYGGDVFGVVDEAKYAAIKQEQEREASLVIPPELKMWGELPPVGEGEEEVEEEEDEEEDEEDEEAAAVDETTPDIGRPVGAEVPYDGTETPAVPADSYSRKSGAGEFNLRKQHHDDDTESSAHPRSAGQVLNQRSIRAEGFFGGDHVYDLGGVSGKVPVLGSGDDRGTKRKAGALDVSVDLDAMEDGSISRKEQLKKQYDAQRAVEGGGRWQDGGAQADYSDMVASETVKRQKREQEREKERKGRR